MKIRWLWGFICSAFLSRLTIGSILPRSSFARTISDDEAFDHSKAPADGGDASLVLSQDNLTTSSSLVKCTQHPTWFRSWTDHMHVEYYTDACVEAWRYMRDTDVKTHGAVKLTFLAEGVPSRSKFAGMMTPRRYIASRFWNSPHGRLTLRP